MKAILVDVTKCTGCEDCVAACIAANGLDAEQAQHDRAAVADGLSAERYLSLLRVDEGRFARKSCLHCLEPSCVAACLVGGITKTADGPVVYDPEKCIGCRYCMLACPFQVPRYEWSETTPFMRKCDMCAERQRAGLEPACVASCPHGALVCGDREELLAEAHARITSGRYRPHIWGEHELGGTSVLYIADVPLDRLGWPDPTARPIPELTTPLIEKTPAIGLGVMSSLLGINWIIRRRMVREAEGGAAATSESVGEGESHDEE